MNNFIKEWSYDKPTEAGYYLRCYGDVETENNVDPVKVVKVRDQMFVLDTKGERTSISTLSDHYKWAKLIYSPTEIKELEE